MEEKQKGTMGWLLDFASPHKSSYVASVIVATLGVAFGIAPYFFVARMVNQLILGNQDMSFYVRYCLYGSAFWMVRYLFHCISTTLSHKATFAVIGEVRTRMTKKLTQLPMGCVLETPSGRLKNIMVERIDSIETTLAHVVPEMTGNSLISLSLIIYLFIMDWRIALATLVTLPLGIFCYMAMMVGYEAKFANYVKKNKHLNATAVEYINGIEVIKAFNQSAASYEKFSSAAREAAESAINWMHSTHVYFSLAMSVFPAVLISVLPVGCLIYMGGNLSEDTLVTGIILALGVMGPLLTTMSYSDDIGKVSTIVGEIAEVMSVPEMERPRDNAVIDSYGIHLKNVSFAYKEEKVLRSVNLTIDAGSVTAFVGPSGGGKSTIAKLIAAMWDPAEGAVSIGGTNLKSIPLRQLNSLIAYVSQDNYLFDDTIRENIRMGKPQASDAEVEQAAKDSGCYDFIMGLERGFETIAGGGGGHLSGGERQRITIARAMLKNAPIIILDEATAYTDPENEAVIQAAVSKLVQGKTLIVIAHRLSTITDSDKIVVIEKGTVHAEGTHQELLKKSVLYQNMWSAHVSAKDSTVEQKPEKGEKMAAVPGKAAGR